MRLLAVALACAAAVGLVAATLPEPAPQESPRPVSAEPAKAGGDLAWTTVGDADGFHVFRARESEGHVWRTVTSLSEPGIETDRWIGNACLTASGRRLVVVYAPRAFTNRPELFLRGGFSAVVDLDTGAVRKLPVRSTLAYYNPGCGAGEDAVLTQAGDSDLGQTRLTTLHAASGTLEAPVTAAGQITSAVPTPQGLVAAGGPRVVRVDPDGSLHTLARSTGTPFELHPDHDGGVWFMDRARDQVRVRRHHDGGTRSYALGATGRLGLSPGAGGRVFVTGLPNERRFPESAARPGERAGALPPTASWLAVPATAAASSTGVLAVAAIENGEGRPAADGPRITTVAARTGRQHVESVPDEHRVPALPDQGHAPSPRPGARTQPGPRAAEDPHDPVDADRTCSVPRGDVRTQVYQPTPHQVEWAADMLAQGPLDLERPADWKGSGLPAYAPSRMFPPVPLAGGGRIPAQILLGITAQESNMWQASRHTAEGLAGNPLIGNYYGIPFKVAADENQWDVDWTHADCGYGITQVTDGMRMAGRTKPGEVALPPDQQRAITVDYAANLAAAARILAEKWNEQAAAGMRVHDGDPTRLENWFMAVWAYNSGFYPKKGAGEPWGLGWLNNPANAHYRENRLPFLDGRPGDASRPQEWPYPEKVMGWAAHSIGKTTGNNGVGFQPAWWNTNDQRAQVKPPRLLFCQVKANDCNSHLMFVPDDPSVMPTKAGEKPEPPSHCGHINPATGKYDLKCWWHEPVEWKKDCATQCGHEKIRFDAGTHPNPPDTSVHRPNCQAEDLPQGVLVVDDVPADVPAVTPVPCPRRSDGTFTFDFAKDAKTGDFLSKIDLHQIGGGFGGHFWFTHSRAGALGDRLKVTGRWELGRDLDGWARVMVHMPNHGAHTQQAAYTVHTADGPKRRTLLQRTEENRWVPLGAFRFTGRPRVELTSVTGGAPDGKEDIAFDAIAFQPLPGKPRHQVVTLGDSFAAGEGASPVEGSKYYPESDRMGLTAYANACHRSYAAWSRKARLPGSRHTLGYRTDVWDPEVDAHLLACSGARTQMLLPTAAPGQEPVRNAFGLSAEGQHREPPQLDKGFLDADTTLVLLSIGGNDAGFADIFTTCFVTVACHENLVLDLDGTTRKRITQKVAPSVKTALQEIAKAAPNAKIVVMGYVKLFTASCDTTSQPGQTAALNPEAGEVEWMGEITLHLRDQLAAVVKDLREGPARLDVHFTDPIDRFGARGVCGNPEAVNAGIPKPTRGEGEQGGFPGLNPPMSQQSFHPNELGTTILADALTTDLPLFGYPRANRLR
ncbi:golvesin C-terminal-like domain-containing protein [Streptomyces venezuelae]|uniref:golvesin C-terminal-like domain-containing protein n=1 Tax=Streptomyces venezuelae TaxID=54571 RepID=UPI00363D8762